MHDACTRTHALITGIKQTPIAHFSSVRPYDYSRSSPPRRCALLISSSNPQISSHLPKMTSAPLPSIPEWFSKRKVLVTGSTGFMGKVLVSKLLTSCPDITTIFLLIREKKGHDPQIRLKSIVQQEPFRMLRENQPDQLKKIVVISGDVSKEELDLSASDKGVLIDEVSVVFHMAANVRFDLPLRPAILMNTKGTLNMLELAKQMTHLKAFIHVSTAFCQCGETVLEDRAYPSLLTPEIVLSAVESFNDATLDAITPKLLGAQPNTYAFSKALGEDLVRRCELPAGVARPSIVVASWKEPVPGWVENMNGPTGLMVGAAKGVVRTMHCNPNHFSDIIPCDMAVNATITLAWKVGLEVPKKPIFMNVTEGGENPLTWGVALETGRKHALTHPFSNPLWYPGGGITSSKLLHSLAVLFFHLLPAYLLDALLYVTGNKPFMVRVQAKVSGGLELLQYYTTKQWLFRNTMMKQVQSTLCPADRETFFSDTKAICWDKFIFNYILGTRQYCLKDDLSTLPRARKVFKYLYIADCALRALVVMLIVWFIYSWIVPLPAVISISKENSI